MRQREKVVLWAHAVIVVSKERNGQGRVTEFKIGWVESFRWEVFLIVIPNPESLIKEVARSVNLIIWSKRGTDQFPTHTAVKTRSKFP